MTFPLSKYERDLLYEFENLYDNYDDSSCVILSCEEYLKYQSWVGLLHERGFIMVVPYDNGKACTQIADFKEFNKWVDDTNKKAKGLNSREWKIAVVSALIGVAGTVMAQILL